MNDTKTQSIPNGTRVIFSTDLPFEEFIDYDITEAQFDSVQGKEATVMLLETFTELGEQDYEYYCIDFTDGLSLSGISGACLTIIP